MNTPLTRIDIPSASGRQDTANPRKHGVPPVAILAALVVATGVVTVAVASTPADQTDRVLTPNAIALNEVQNQGPATPRTYYGTASCKRCHDAKLAAEDICRGFESVTWQSEDKHARAYDVLLSDRAKRIGKVVWGNENVTDKKECLTCHAVWFDRTEAKANPNFRVEEGVSCVACHGANTVVLGKDELPIKNGWVELHLGEYREAWRKKSRKDKEIDYGMIDLWDPVKRTQVCASCHIGNVDQEKVVTHDMYAGGHPPLPGFEIVTFGNQMPRHWQDLNEKPDWVLKVLEKSKREAHLERVHLLAVGGLVSLRESLQLLAKTKTETWPEFANYSCYACHHDLQSDSWRLKRGYPGIPGRPPMHEWPATLIDFGLFHAAADDSQAVEFQKEFQTFHQQLQNAIVGSQPVKDAPPPFGKQATVAKAAEKLVDWLDGKLRLMRARMTETGKAVPYTDNEPRRLFDWLHADLAMRAGTGQPAGKAKTAAALPRWPDYDSARQLTWAFQVMHLDTAAKSDPKAWRKREEELRKHPDWAKLSEYLRLRMPEGNKLTAGSVLEPEFEAALRRLKEYDPRHYFQNLDAVLKQLKSP